MNRRRIEDQLVQIESIARSIEQSAPGFSGAATSIRSAIAEIRREITPPQEGDNRPRTRDEISPREWAEYEWVDVTAMGDTQRQYLRGLKR